MERVEPRQAGREVPDRRRAVTHLDQGHDREHEQHGELDAQQHLLEIGRDLDADVADGRHQHDPHDPDQQHPAAAGVAADPLGVEQEEEVLARHLGQAGHDEQVGGDDAPTPEPSGLGPEGPGTPGERGAAIGVGVVHLLVAVGDEQHRDERQDGDDRSLQAVDGDDHESEGGGQAVGRSGRGHPHHDGGDEPEGAALEPFLADVTRGLRRRRQICHGDPFGEGWQVPYPIAVRNAS